MGRQYKSSDSKSRLRWDYRHFIHFLNEFGHISSNFVRCSTWVLKNTFGTRSTLMIWFDEKSHILFAHHKFGLATESPSSLAANNWMVFTLVVCARLMLECVQPILKSIKLRLSLSGRCRVRSRPNLCRISQSILFCFLFRKNKKRNKKNFSSLRYSRMHVPALAN